MVAILLPTQCPKVWISNYMPEYFVDVIIITVSDRIFMPNTQDTMNLLLTETRIYGDAEDKYGRLYSRHHNLQH